MQWPLKGEKVKALADAAVFYSDGNFAVFYFYTLDLISGTGVTWLLLECLYCRKQSLIKNIGQLFTKCTAKSCVTPIYFMCIDTD